MHKKINFSMFEKKKQQPVTGGLLCEGVQKLLPNSMELHQTIALVAKETLVVWVSKGDWSMHDMLVALLNKTGAAEVSISTYAMSETPARVITQLKSAGMITKLTTILDNRVDTRSAGSFQLMKAMSDAMVLVEDHAKVTVITNATWNIAVIGSANYTENKRYESGVILEHKPTTEMQLLWMQKALQDGVEY